MAAVIALPPPRIARGLGRSEFSRRRRRCSIIEQVSLAGGMQTESRLALAPWRRCEAEWHDWINDSSRERRVSGPNGGTPCTVGGVVTERTKRWDSVHCWWSSHGADETVGLRAMLMDSRNGGTPCTGDGFTKRWDFVHCWWSSHGGDETVGLRALLMESRNGGTPCTGDGVTKRWDFVHWWWSHETVGLRALVMESRNGGTSCTGGGVTERWDSMK